MNDNVISRETYDYFMRYLGYEKFLDKIKGKKLIEEFYTIEDCGVNFVKSLLTSDWGRSIVITYSNSEYEFIKSKYLSDYFKENITNLLSGLMSDELKELLNSDKDINEMEEYEIKLLNDAIDGYYNNVGRTVNSNISAYFLTYLYKLDGRGVTSFIKNNIDGESIARHILLTSGLNDRASYYSGRGVMSCDLNEDNLCEIFNKLFKLDDQYALSFIDMVLDMKTLGATEFINSFIHFGVNKFEYQKRNKDESNISLDGVNDNVRFGVAIGTIMSSMYRRDDDYQIEASKQIKVNFIHRIKNILMNMNVQSAHMIVDKYCYNWRDSYYKYSYRKRK